MARPPSLLEQFVVGMVAAGLTRLVIVVGERRRVAFAPVVDGTLPTERGAQTLAGLDATRRDYARRYGAENPELN